MSTIRGTAMKGGAAMRVGAALFLAVSPGVAGASTICQLRRGALRYVLDSQVAADGPIYHRGEWPSRVRLGGFARALGLLKPGTYEDENLFTTASIHNILAEIQLLYSQDPELIGPLRNASMNFESYRSDEGSFDFWPRVPGSRPASYAPRFQLTVSAVAGLLAIPPDADDTAVAKLGRLEDRLACESRYGRGSPSCPRPDGPVASLFASYRDGIRIAAPSDVLQGEVMTGAYMTWLHGESIIPNLFLALSPPRFGPRVVLDRNDVDCVVNANVLRTLTLTGETGASGYAASCRFVNAAARTGDFNRCGDYYPDTYWYHYAVTRAYEDGAFCLAEGTRLALESVLESQGPDGGWRNQVIDDGDVLSTAFALGALVKAGDPKDPRQLKAVRLGVDYLRSLALEHADGTRSWSGGVFFSAGVPAREDVLWYSDSFTTAVVTLLLYDLNRWLPEAAACRQRSVRRASV